MKKNGFTLVELLAVVGVLAVLTLISIPTIDSLIKRNREKAYKIQIQTIKDGMKSWSDGNTEYLPDNAGETLTIDLGFLKASGFAEIDLTNPITNKCFPNDMALIIRKIANNYEYIVDEDSGTETNEDCKLVLPDGPKIYVFFINSQSMSVRLNSEFIDPGIKIVNMGDEKITYNISTIIKNVDDEIVTKVDTTKETVYKILYNYQIIIKNEVIKSGSLIRNIYIEEPWEEGKEIYYEKTLKGANPELDTNMIPITYENNIPKKANLKNRWYSYSGKKWANAVVVNSSKYQEYIDAPPGTTIIDSDIIGYFVWIPRYKYAIPSGNGPRSIDIIFEDKNTPKSTGNATGFNYLTHPSFTFGTSELNGIWVGKFETTGTSTIPTIKPNLSPLTMLEVSKAVATSKLFEKNLKNADAHLIKNTDWGAVAYLSHSTYGINKEIRLNNTNKTGCGAASDNQGYSSTCENSYLNYNELYPQSTTGNITGIFDMSGGVAEQTFAAIATSTNVLRAGHASNSCSGFVGYLNDGSWNTGGVALPDPKYFNDMTFGSKLGMAYEECQNWYGDSFLGYNPSYSWTLRGGNMNQSTGAGIFAKTDYYTGTYGDTIGSRIAITNN